VYEKLVLLVVVICLGGESFERKEQSLMVLLVPFIHPVVSQLRGVYVERKSF